MGSLESASITATTRNLIKWQLHTMTRPNEAAGTRWEEIDFEKEIWTTSPSRMKKSRTQNIPLTKQALCILAEMKKEGGYIEFVFPAERNPRKNVNKTTANMALRQSALAHIDNNSVRRAYNRAEYLKQRGEMMSWWSRHIENSGKLDTDADLLPKTHQSDTF